MGYTAGAESYLLTMFLLGSYLFIPVIVGLAIFEMKDKKKAKTK